MSAPDGKLPSSFLYIVLCHVLSGRTSQVDWLAFDPPAWEAFARQANAEGVAPLIYWTFEREGWPSSASRAFRQSLAEAYYQSAARNALLLAELERILHVLASARIPVIVLKGAALIQSTYPDPASRPMNDLDILVKPEDLGRAIQVVSGCGYTLQKITYHAYLVGSQPPGLAVEVHWSLVGVEDQKAGLAWLWSQLEPWGGAYAGAPVYRLNPLAQLLYLSAHMAIQHAGQSPHVKWVYDLARLLEVNPQLDLVSALSTAGSLGWGDAFGWSLQAMQPICGLPPDRLPGALTTRVFTPPPHRDTAFWVRQGFAILPWSLRLQLLIGLLLPSPDYIRWRYKPSHASLWPLCYLLRWGDLLRKQI